MATHIDAVIHENQHGNNSREAKVNSTEERGVIGVPIFLTTEELEKQGINPEEADKIVVRVEDGFIFLDQRS